MKVAIAIMRQSFMDSMAYSASTFVWLAIAMLEILVPMIIWLSATPIGGSFGGFTKSQILTYYALMTFVGNFTFWWVHFGIAERVRSGDLSNLLLKPFSAIRYFILFQMGEKIFSFAMRLPIFLAVFYFFGQSINFSAFALLAMVTGSAVYLLICLIFSMLAFYMTDLGGLISLFYFTVYLLSGELAPLTFYPDWFSKIALLLPFRYILSFPIEIFMNRLTQSELIYGFGVQLFWLVSLSILLKIFWKRALNTYQAYGK